MRASSRIEYWSNDNYTVLKVLIITFNYELPMERMRHLIGKHYKKGARLSLFCGEGSATLEQVEISQLIRRSAVPEGKRIIP
ncbi:MAG: hypothetical protein V4674_00325 [Patescibacteria group bacterium]